MELWLSTLGLIFLHSYNVQEPWLGNTCVRCYKKNKHSLLPHSSCLITTCLGSFCQAGLWQQHRCFPPCSNMLNIWKSILEYSLPGKPTLTLSKFFFCSFPENSLHRGWLQSFFCTCLGLKGSVTYQEFSLFSSTILCVSPGEPLSLSQTEHVGCLCHLFIVQTALPRAPVRPDCPQHWWI